MTREETSDKELNLVVTYYYILIFTRNLRFVMNQQPRDLVKY